MKPPINRSEIKPENITIDSPLAEKKAVLPDTKKYARIDLILVRSLTLYVLKGDGASPSSYFVIFIVVPDRITQEHQSEAFPQKRRT
jgi:hypothetical protein